MLILFEDLQLLYRNILPFSRKWIRLSADYEGIHQQMLSDMQQQDYVAT